MQFPVAREIGQQHDLTRFRLVSPHCMDKNAASLRIDFDSDPQTPILGKGILKGAGRRT